MCATCAMPPRITGDISPCAAVWGHLPLCRSMPCTLHPTARSAPYSYATLTYAQACAIESRGHAQLGLCNWGRVRFACTPHVQMGSCTLRSGHPTPVGEQTSYRSRVATDHASHTRAKISARSRHSMPHRAAEPHLRTPQGPPASRQMTTCSAGRQWPRRP